MNNNWASTRNTNVHIALDLGSDTLKIAYAFTLDNREYTGKIVHNKDTMTALPAVAFYDAEQGKWFFGEEVTRQQGKAFLTVVKIKHLISLLQCLGDDSKMAKLSASNTDFYKNKEYFPKFYFPVDKNDVDEYNQLVMDFNQLIDKDRAFVAQGYTPKRVCELFFRHVAEIVHERVAIMMKQFDCGYSLHLSVVYPPHVGKEYVDELKRLVAVGFDNQYSVDLVLSMTKALSIYASERGLIGSGQSALIFNVGEEKTFVAKANLYGKGAGKGLSIDGVEGHNPPVDLGGNDIDRAVYNYLENFMREKETMGCPSAGAVGHIYESGLRTKQYQFLQEIKSAKILFGMYDQDDSLFKDGVPINVSRDLFIRLRLKHSEFCECIGVNGKNAAVGSFTESLCKYIESELTNSINRDVSHVFISGGVVETYNLVDVIRARLKNKSTIQVGTFESQDSERYNANSDGFDIFSHEDAVYAPAVGCAIAALYGITVKTVTSLSYGTDAYVDSKGVFSLLLDKNKEIPEQGRAPDAQPYYVRSGSVDASLLIFSLNLSAQEIRNKTFQYDREVNVEYTADGELSLEHLINKFRNHKVDSYVRKLEKKIGFRQRNKDKDAVITFHYGGRRVKLDSITYAGREDKFDFFAGIKIDGSGVATPYAANNTERNKGKKIRIVELVERYNGDAFEGGYSATVWATDIELRCKPFTVKVEGRD